MKVLATVVACLLLAGCNFDRTGLTSDEKAQIQDALKVVLKDAESAKIEWLPMPDPLQQAGDQTYCFKVNAKNGFGAYAGFQNVSVKIIRLMSRSIIEKLTLGGC